MELPDRLFVDLAHDGPPYAAYPEEDLAVQDGRHYACYRRVGTFRPRVGWEPVEEPPRRTNTGGHR